MPQPIYTKICGITRVEDALIAAQSGANAIGLIFYPKSKRHIDITTAQKIAAALPPFVNIVGLFVNESAENIQQILRAVPLHILQFHGDESPEFCQQFHRPYIKAVRVRTRADIEYASSQYPNARALLLDAYNDQEYGGTGHSFDWTQLPDHIPQNWILAGGLSPENIHRALSISGARNIDVASGVEASAGIKDTAKIARFFQEIQRHQLEKMA